MKVIYPVLFYEEKEGNYSVFVPDLDNSSTCGETLEEAMSMAIDCLAGHIRWLERDGEPIPTPSALNNIDAKSIAKELDPDSPYNEAFVTMVSVDVEEYAKKHFEKSVRKTLTIPAWLNTIALEQGINFSQTLQEALLAKVQSH